MLQGGSNTTGTNCLQFTHKKSRSYLNHLVHIIWTDIWRIWHACFFPFIYLFVSFILYVHKWRLKSLLVMQWANFLLVSTFNWFVCTPLLYYILLHLIIPNNSYCTKTSNTVLDHVIVVHLVLVSPLDSLKCDYLHIHMDFVILYGSTEGK